VVSHRSSSSHSTVQEAIFTSCGGTQPSQPPRANFFGRTLLLKWPITHSNVRTRSQSPGTVSCPVREQFLAQGTAFPLALSRPRDASKTRRDPVPIVGRINNPGGEHPTTLDTIPPFKTASIAFRLLQPINHSRSREIIVQCLSSWEIENYYPRRHERHERHPELSVASV